MQLLETPAEGSVAAVAVTGSPATAKVGAARKEAESLCVTNAHAKDVK